MQVETVEIGQDKSTLETEVVTLRQTVQTLIMHANKQAQDIASLTEMVNKIATVYRDMHAEVTRHKEMLDNLPMTSAQPSRPRRALSYDMWQKVKELITEEGNYAAVARSLGIPASTVRKYAKMPEDEAQKLGGSDATA